MHRPSLSAGLVGGAAYALAAACGNGEDDDGDGLADFDDPECSDENPCGERLGCGLGVERVALLLPGLWLARRRSERVRP